MIHELEENVIERFQLGSCLFHARIEMPSHVSKKNNRPIHGRGSHKWIGKSERLRFTETFLTLKLKELADQQGLSEPIDLPIWAVLHFHFPKDVYLTKKGVMNKKLPDLSNLYELPQDCLERAGVILNDSLICSHDYSRRLIGDRFLLEVFLLEYQTGQ